MLLRVVKLGGSLLDLPDLAGRVQRWLGGQPPASNVIVVGGGALAEAIRASDRIHKLDEVAAHWLCIRTMSVTAQLAATLLDLPVVDELAELTSRAAQHSTFIFDACPYLLVHEPTLPGTPLEHGWHVTSDSISARLAESLAADELVLLKSTLAPAPLDLASAADQKLVDPWFPQAARSIARIRVVNLRSPGFSELALAPYF
jgi:aspartokinase-like uncharacterized kinase